MCSESVKQQWRRLQAEGGPVSPRVRKMIDKMRPKTRGDCTPCLGCQSVRDGDADMCIVHGSNVCAHARPCLFLSCRFNLAIEVKPSGSIVYVRDQPHPEEYLSTMPASCALDVAENRLATLEEIGAILGATRERVRQIEESAARHFRAKYDGDDAADAARKR